MVVVLLAQDCDQRPKGKENREKKVKSFEK